MPDQGPTGVINTMAKGDEIYASWTGQKASFGMSWFWFPEGQFGCAPGVVRTVVGFAGGSSLNPTYRRLGDHTETIQVEYDPEVTNYSKLLEIFWANHNPTSKCSRQYMSAIFYHDQEQKKLAEESMKVEQKKRNASIQTKILPMGVFTNAEDYHQKYLLQRYPYILAQMDIDPGDELINSFVAARLNGYVGGYGTLSAFEGEKERFGLSPKIISYVQNIVAKAKGPDVDC